MTQKYYPILGKGEVLSRPVDLVTGGYPKKDIRDFDAARKRLLPQFEELIERSQSMPESYRISRGVFFCLDIDYYYVAKSYYPHYFINFAEWELVGSIAWDQTKRDEVRIPKQQSRRLYFRGTPKSIANVYSSLKKSAIPSKTMQKELFRFDSVHMADSVPKTESLKDALDGELVELIIHSMLESDWQECLDKLKAIISFDGYPEFLYDWVRGGVTKGPRFLPAKVTQEAIAQLGHFNPLRSIRIMPKVSFPRLDIGDVSELGLPPKGDPLRLGDTPEIGVFDGGVDARIPHLGMWVVPEDLTPEPVNEDSLIHGTAVCGAALYGHYDSDKRYDSPSIMVKSFRIFPVPKIAGFDLDLYQVLDWMEQAITDNTHIKTFVLSFGPDIPIDDNEIDPFTTTLDRLAYEKGVLFVVAAGNKGRLSPPFNRIQPPSDIINGLGVGAYKQDLDGQLVPASYSCIGPGRCGNAIKPDVHAFGGDDGQLFNVFLAGGDGKCTGVKGTSFAAPVVSSTAGHLLHRVDDHKVITPQTVKALLIHNAQRGERWDPNYGWGALKSTAEDIMTCTDDAVTIIYNGEIEFKKCLRLNIPFFDDAARGGYVKFRWTFVFATGIAPSMPDEYSLAGTDISFRPHADVFSFTSKGKRVGSANIVKDKAKAQHFVKIGAKQSRHPKTKSPYRTEQQRREDGVWDTVDHCWTNKMRLTSVHNPCLDVHAIPRSEWEYGPQTPGKISYAAVVSIEFTRPEAQLYQLVRSRIPELIQVRLTSRARLRT